LEEEEVCRLPEEELSPEEAVLLHRAYGKQIDIDFPSPLNQGNYRLRSRGYVGQFPVGRQLLLHVRPKVSLQSLFGMVEYAYQLRFLHLRDGSVLSGSIGEVFEHLAAVLARWVLDRVHSGLLRDYLEQEEDLPYVRGRVLPVPERRGGEVGVRCRFQEHTPDLMDNRILAWTLHLLRQRPFHRHEVGRRVQQAFRLLSGAVGVAYVAPQACSGRFYHRQNQDYQPMHALCRFFLEHSGPALGAGDREFVPFMVYMPGLFETFVAEWLKVHLEQGFDLQIQRRLPLEGSQGLAFQIDLALGEKGRTLAVLDTKYKREGEPEEADIQQVVAYAVRMGTQKAVLIYPSRETKAFVVQVGSVKVSSLVFDLSRELVEAGSCFHQALLDIVL